jgi:hypothetical protein
MSSGRFYKAVIGRVIPGGRHGAYAVCHNEELGSVTMSLQPDVWQENDWPTPGTIVLLWDIRQKTAGWRAEKGRFYRPEDADPAS